MELREQKQLLKEAQNGNSSAFGVLYAQYAKEFYYYALRFFGNKEDAEDAVQEAALRVYKHISSIQKPEAFKAFFFKTLSNTAKTMYQKKKSSPLTLEKVPEQESTENVELSVTQKADIEVLLLSLPPEERQIVLLSVVGGFSSREIAEAVDLTAGAVRAKLSRTLHKLRRSLEESEALK